LYLRARWRLRLGDDRTKVKAKTIAVDQQILSLGLPFFYQSVED
jgi:hypothetical protein